jgi:hypothetical protein
MTACDSIGFTPSYLVVVRLAAEASSHKLPEHAASRKDIRP